MLLKSSVDNVKMLTVAEADVAEFVVKKGSRVTRDTVMNLGLPRGINIGGMFRDGHAFHLQEEFIVALSGSFDVVLNDGTGEQRFHMARSYYGLYVPSMTWRAIDNFSTNSVALVLSSTHYDSSDYIEDFNQFLKLKNG